MAFHQPSGMPAQTTLPIGWSDAPTPKPMPAADRAVEREQ